MPKNLTAFFSPKSIAIVGASRSPKKVGAVILKNLIESGYKGVLYPINQEAKTLSKIKCYKKLSDLPEIPELVIISIPSIYVSQVLKEAGEKGSKNVVIISAGFKETGAEGKSLEDAVVSISKEYGINILGPNCLGFVNNDDKVNATFGKVASLDGNLNFITQSGAIATSLFDWCGSVGVGFSNFVTLGNKADINENDVMEYLFEKYHGSLTSLSESDENLVTRPLGLYLESVVEGPRFLEVCKKITKREPVFIIKPGKSKAAASAMQSHTGAIAGADDVLDSALKEAGVIRCHTLEDFFDLSKAFSWSNLPAGPRVAIISNAGGPAVISADSAVENGLEIADLGEDTRKKLLEVLPRSASIMNPVDVLGDALAQRFADASEIVLKNENCDALVVLLTPQIMTQIKKTAEMIGEISKKYHKPVLCSFIGGSLVGEGEKILNNMHIPSFRFPERAIYALGKMWEFKKRQDENAATQMDIYQVLNFDIMPEKVNKLVKEAIDKKQPALNNIESDIVISAIGINTPPTLGVDLLEDAKKFATVQGYPLVLKLSSPGLLHKKNVGGVVLDIKNEDELEDAWEILERKKQSLPSEILATTNFQIQREVPSGTEVIVGVKSDPTFGHFMLFGAGGSLAELISDKNIALLPMDLNKARKLVEGSKIFRSLKGKDGKTDYALEKLYELMVKVSKIVEGEPGIQEIEINPVIININDVWAVDTKVILTESKQISQGPLFKNAKVLKAENLTPKMHYFEFEADEKMDVIPGQYISVKVSDSRVNCYSVAGFTSPNRFNLLVDSTPGGPGSKFFESLKVGDKMAFLGPFGNFTLKQNEDVENMLFFATGCGVAPLKFMLESVLKEDNKSRKVKLYLGVNNYCDVFFKDYFDDLQKKYENFSYEIAVNNPDPKWNGPVGFITELVKKDISNASKCSAYLCGNKFMIEDVSKVLIEKGCSEERIYTEKYGK